jgi:hypothetical protein
MDVLLPQPSTDINDSDVARLDHCSEHCAVAEKVTVFISSPVVVKGLTHAVDSDGILEFEPIL